MFLMSTKDYFLALGGEGIRIQPVILFWEVNRDDYKFIDIGEKLSNTNLGTHSDK